MNIDKIINILNINSLCIKCQQTPFCSKKCDKCNFQQSSRDLIIAQQSAIKILTQIKEIKLDD